MQQQTWGIHWFRRDLRVEGNQALHENIRANGGRTVCLFCFDSQFLSRDDFSNNRFAFFLETIEALKSDLQAIGADLLVVDSRPQEAFAEIVKAARASGISSPSLVTWNRDYEPFARKRDSDMEEFFVNQSISHKNFRDHLLFEPTEVNKSEGEYYKVYSPWAKKWFAKLASEEGRKRIALSAHPTTGSRVTLSWVSLFQSGEKKARPPYQDALEAFKRENNKKVRITLPKAGRAAGLKMIKNFKPQLKRYHEERDYPGLDATSRLSMFLKNGSLVLADVIRELDLVGCKYDTQDGSTKFLKELAWREFYYSILFHWPHVEHGPFQKKYEAVKWVGDKRHFEAWKEGRTGFPIVDAAMRELRECGWITNRVRIIVSSFLIKDLLINWQEGELHFMHLLLDGDLAPNNGNWQWSASTGSDPNPYFRVMSPWAQGKKFDPKGEYIKRWVPELSTVPVKAYHEPEADRSVAGYPAPIVDHSKQRLKAIAMMEDL